MTSPTAITAATVDTDAGPLSILAAGNAVVAAGYTDPTTLYRRLPDTGRGELVAGDLPPGVAEPLARYLAGELEALAEVPVDPVGTDFQHSVWNALRDIPVGETRSYAQLAVAAGRPSAVRAVGSACGANLIAPFIPCHRALRSDGSLGGYEYGLDVKRRLLGLEDRQLHLDTE